MFSNYLKTAYRSMIRNFTHTFINVIGLAVGMTCALIIYLWIQNELSVDQWVTQKDNIYRVECETWVVMPPYMTDLIDDLPEVEKAVRFFLWSTPVIKFDEKVISTKNFAICDSTLFDIFDFPFIFGDPSQALKEPFSLVLAESTASKLFGNTNPVGKEVLLNNNEIYTITGVITDVDHLHMEFEGVISAQDIARLDGDNSFLEATNHNFLNFILTVPNVNKEELDFKINELILEDGRWWSPTTKIITRKFTDIYFARGLPHESGVMHGNIHLIYIFSAISILILLVACINFINITTAKANLREREIAIRKITGAQRNKLTFQFLGETFILVIIAHILSVVLLELSLPKFNQIIHEKISFNYLSTNFISISVIAIVITTFVSGLYPSTYLSRLKSVNLLKGKSNTNTSKSSTRKLLTISQFVISIFLIISTITIIKQLKFVMNKDLGFKIENQITFRIRGELNSGENEDRINNKQAFAEQIKKHPNVLSVTYMGQLPGKITNTWNWNHQGESVEMRMINAEANFIDHMGLELIAGRNFSTDNLSDLNQVAIINETALKALNLEDPVGTYLEEENLTVIGVVKDFNFNSLHTGVIPMGIRWRSWPSRTIVNIGNNDIPGTIKHLEKIYEEFCPDYPFDYEFLDTSFGRQYQAEIRLSRILIFFAFIAIFIAGLGLFGMSAFMTATRQKEIGIRKAIGSSTMEIILLFSSRYTRWILISFVIASPVAWYLIKKWLSQYPYQTSVSWWVFALALIISAFIALATIGYQIIKSARMNPANSLRYE